MLSRPSRDPGGLRPEGAVPHQSLTRLWVSERLKHFLNLSLFQGDHQMGCLVTPSVCCLPAWGEQRCPPHPLTHSTITTAWREEATDRGMWLVWNVLGQRRGSVQARQLPFGGLLGKSSSLKGSKHSHPLPPISYNLVGGLNLQVGTLGTVWSRAKALQQDSGQRVQASSVGGHSVWPLAKHLIVLGLSFFICKIKGWFPTSLPALK